MVKTPTLGKPIGAYELRVDVEGTIPPDDVIFDGEVLFEITVELF